MTLARTTLLAFLTFGLGMTVTTSAFAEKKALKPTMTWQGSIDDEALMKDVPEVITNVKDLEKLWKALKLENMPKVDFDKELFIATTSRGSKVNLIASLDTDKSDLMVGGFGTRDLRPGFRYVFGTVSKEGVKTVNGKVLK